VQPFRETAFYLLTWRAFVVALIALVPMITRGFELAVACLIGADVALLFSLGLIAWNSRLDDERVVLTEAWRLSHSEQRLAGQAARRWARSALGESALRFAKASAMVAIALSASALVMSAA
jgi:hypothetical protein